MSRDPSTWRVLAAHAHTPPERNAQGITPPDPGDVVDLPIDRGLAGGRLDVLHLPPDEAIRIATDLLTAVRTLRERQARR